VARRTPFGGSSVSRRKYIGERWMHRRLVGPENLVGQQDRHNKGRL
jgi:hypothetical protein